MISLDTETTGVDMRHGAAPFFVTTCDDHGEQQWWEWDVDPLTRRPIVPQEDALEVYGVVQSAAVNGLVAQNSKFDVAALVTALGLRHLGLDWPWESTHDTLIAGHVLASNRPHDLTSMAVQYLGRDIEPYEEPLHQAVLKARRVVQQARLKEKRKSLSKKPPKPKKRPRKEDAAGHLFSEDIAAATEPPDPLASWAIAAADREDMPSARGKVWKFDTWLPRALIQYWRNNNPKLYEEFGGDKSPWWTVLSDYANTDSAVTIMVWNRQREELERRGLWKIYNMRRRVMGIAFKMEDRGVTVSEERLSALQAEYREESASARRVCVNIAKDEHNYDLELPRNGVNNSLRRFVYEMLELEPIMNKRARSANPTLNKDVLEYYLLTLPQNKLARTFVRMLSDMRKRDTALNYMNGYRKFWKPLLDGEGRPVPDWYVLHPHLNPTGTDTLRWSSAQPNEQNISKKEGFNLRYCFGPAPGREWWSLDAKNIELRIPAYESGEEAFIELFERPDDPPYFGSNHLLVSHIIYPKEFEACVNEGGQVDGRIFKKKYASTLYHRIKCGNFAVQYGAVDKADGSGTADKAYGVPGAHFRIKSRFAKQEALNQKWIAFAQRHGYVETMPSNAIDPERGYPILCTRTEWGGIKPTVPLNYHVQSTAMEWMQMAMIRCDEQLGRWRRDDGFDGYMVMQVHDELVFDFPQSIRTVRAPGGKLRTEYGNLGRIKTIQRLMEQGGEDIGVPTPVSCECHAETWAEGVSL
jgi:DNA polymerase I-like protein with 3'-5' exonuclease and polymerase domains